MNKNTYTLLLFFCTMWIACKKNEYRATQREYVQEKALVKLGLFSMYAVNNPSFVMYSNGVKISPAIPSPYGYPGGGFNVGGSVNADYLALEPGNNKFDFFNMLPNTNYVVSKLFETTQTIAADKRYTLFIADTAANTTAILAEDNGSDTKIDSGYAKVRFVHLIPNAPALDLYKNDSLIISNVTYKSLSNYITIPSSGVDSFAIRPAGSAKDYAVKATAFYRLVLPTEKRVLNIIARGYIGTTAPRIPSVSVLLSK